MKHKILVAALALTLATGLYAGKKHIQAARATDEALCLAKVIYYEARGEPLQGKLLVAATAINRTKSARFPNTVCEVIYQPWQFSWTMDPKRKVRDLDAWDAALELSYKILYTTRYKLNQHVMYFHNHTVAPVWASTKKIVAQIGNHTYYAEPKKLPWNP